MILKEAYLEKGKRLVLVDSLIPIAEKKALLKKEDVSI